MAVNRFRHYFLEQCDKLYSEKEIEKEIEKELKISVTKLPAQFRALHPLEYKEEYFRINYRIHGNQQNRLITFLPSNDKLFDCFQVQNMSLNCDGSGSSGYVEPCKVVTNKYFHKGKPFVIKRCYAQPMNGVSHIVYLGGLSLRKEAAILHAIQAMPPDYDDKKYIVTYAFSGVSSDGSPYIVMERLLGGTLEQFVLENDHLAAYQIKKYAKQLIFGARFIARCGMSHQDLKANNIMFHTTAKEHLKIIDFNSASAYSGIAADYENSKPHFNAGGTAMIKAPEYIVDGAKITEKADLWSVGLLILFMAVGQKNYDAFTNRLYDKNNRLNQSFIDKELSSLLTISMVNNSIRRTISGLLTVDVSSRFSAEQALFTLLSDANPHAQYC